MRRRPQFLLLLLAEFASAFRSGFHIRRPRSFVSLAEGENIPVTVTNQCQKGRLNKPPSGKVLIHWKGEDVEGYTFQFRHLEFRGALSAVTNFDANHVQFIDALEYNGSQEMLELKRILYNEAMQYVTVEDGSVSVSRKNLIEVAQRCSLVHAIYEVVSVGKDYDELLRNALQTEGFHDLYVGEENAQATWCFRVRHYGDQAGSRKETRHSARARSITSEKEALQLLTPLLKKFGGKVNLAEPDCKIYMFDGLNEGKVLTRRLARGPRFSTIAPNTRICITNTPLCPKTSFAMCNIAQLKEHQTILDPYAGSGTILLAAAMISPTVKSVGIEIAHDGLVNRSDIFKDFAVRNLTKPIALIQGNCSDELIRDQAKAAIGSEAFDHIITDPPYGIRESKLALNPIDELLGSIQMDREAGRRLLKVGGHLVCFIPCTNDENIVNLLPTAQQLHDAGLELEIVQEQPLNDYLSRWLVSYVCLR